MTLNELANDIHDNAKRHGWWDQPREFGTVVALCHSELSEALEEHRNGRPMVYADNYHTEARNLDPRLFSPLDKPEGIAVEMIDCVIRILDYLAHEGVDIDLILRLKHNYNRNRPYRHGGKVC